MSRLGERRETTKSTSDSVKTYNLESLSARFRSKCFRTETAFLIKWYKSSGMEGFKPIADCLNDARIGVIVSLPLDFKIRRILLPVMNLTWGTPCESRKMTPI